MEVRRFNGGERIVCPVCGDHYSMMDIDSQSYKVGDVDYHDLCICDECGAELYAEPQYDGSIKWVKDIYEESVDKKEIYKKVASDRKLAKDIAKISGKKAKDIMNNAKKLADDEPLKEAKENLIGKKVIIKAKDSWFYDEWGTVVDVDGDDIYVAIANDRSSVPVFSRREIRVMKDRSNESITESKNLNEAPDIYGIYTDSELDSIDADSEVRLAKDIEDLKKRYEQDKIKRRNGAQQQREYMQNVLSKLSSLMKKILELDGGLGYECIDLFDKFGYDRYDNDGEYYSDKVRVFPITLKRQNGAVGFGIKIWTGLESPFDHPTITYYKDTDEIETYPAKLLTANNIYALNSAAEFIENTVLGTRVNEMIKSLKSMKICLERENDQNKRQLKRYFSQDIVDNMGWCVDISNPGYYAHGGAFYVFEYKGKYYWFEAYNDQEYIPIDSRDRSIAGRLRVFKEIEKPENTSNPYSYKAIRDVEPPGSIVSRGGLKYISSQHPISVLESITEAKKLKSGGLKYYVASYPDKERKMVYDNLMSDDESEISEFVYDQANRGEPYIEIKNLNNGKVASIDDDFYSKFSTLDGVETDIPYVDGDYVDDFLVKSGIFNESKHTKKADPYKKSRERLSLPANKVHKDKSKYSRKEKHKGLSEAVDEDNKSKEVIDWWRSVEDWNYKNGNQYNIINDEDDVDGMYVAMWDMLRELKDKNTDLYNKGKKIYDKYKVQTFQW